jgi:putative flippase GtrA
MSDSASNEPDQGTITPASALAGNVATQRLLLLLLSPDHRIGQIMRFGLMTAMSASVTVGLPVLLHEVFDVAPRHGAAIAFLVAFFLNFISLRRLVFRSEGGLGRDLLTFVISSLMFRGGEYLAFLVLTGPALHIHYIVALLGVLSLSALAKFFWYRKVLHSA